MVDNFSLFSKVQKNDSITMKAKFTGTPTPKITWSKDDEPVQPSKNAVIDTNGSSTKLTIPKPTSDDTGTYTVTATNDVSEETKTIELTVVSVPDKPTGPLEVMDIQQSSCQISWQPPEKDGGEPVTGYLVERRDVKKSTWVRVTSVKSDTTAVTVEGLLEDVDYMIRISAINKVGPSEPLETDKPVRPRNPYSVPSPPLGPLQVRRLNTSWLF